MLLRRDREAYLSSRQYKGVKSGGILEFRDVRFPCANEALAEAALLAHCSEIEGPFAAKADVFSYHLADPSSHEGSFKLYFKLFAARQAAIAEACRRWPNDLVLYVDIKSFYPSLTLKRARRAWIDACKTGNVERAWRALGLRLIDDQSEVGSGLMVGPMFSHLLGNLSLLEVDARMRKRYQNRYFRYVDDIALVIPHDEKDAALQFLQRALGSLELRLNPKKTCHLTASEWLSSAQGQTSNYEGETHTIEDTEWMIFIDDLKCYLIANPEHSAGLAERLRANGVRVSVPHYQATIESADYVARFERRLRRKGFQRRVSQISIQGIVSRARILSYLYQENFDEVWEEFQRSDSVKRKWLLSRLRYLLSKLVVIAEEDQLTVISSRLEGLPELAEYAAVFRALTTRDVSDLVRYSGKVNTGAGQALATSGATVRCQPTQWNRETIEGFVALNLIGVNLLTQVPTRVERNYHVRFVNGRCSPTGWTTAPNGFLQELIALSGESSLKRHQRLLSSPIDPDERWVLFTDELQNIDS